MSTRSIATLGKSDGVLETGDAGVCHINKRSE